MFFWFFLWICWVPLWGNAQSLTEGILPSNPNLPSLPSDLKILQEAVWKNYRFQLMLSPSQPYLRGPSDFFISAKKELMGTAFPGSITVSFENLSQKSPLQETSLHSEDYEEDGLAKISHSFTEAGEYAVTLSFTDQSGDLFVMRGNVEIPSENFFSKHLKLLYGVGMGLGGIVLTFIFVRRARSKGKS